jgi:hypothetical protein
MRCSMTIGGACFLDGGAAGEMRDHRASASCRELATSGGTQTSGCEEWKEKRRFGDFRSWRDHVTQQSTAFSFLRLSSLALAAGIGLAIMGATGGGPPQLPSEGDRVGKQHEAVPAGTGRGVAPSRPHDAASADEQRRFVQMLILGGVVGHPFGFFK